MTVMVTVARPSFTPSIRKVPFSPEDTTRTVSCLSEEAVMEALPSPAVPEASAARP